MIINILNLIRVKDWSKNIIIFLPIIFSGNLKNSSLYFDLLITFILFSLVSSFIYIINDILDIEDDKKQQLKVKKKPLASGKLSKKFAIFVLFVILLFLFVGFLKYKHIYLYLSFYLLINLSYSLYLKKIPIVDVFLPSLGYLIRLDLGSNIINVKTTILLGGTIFFLACFIIFIKRFVELKNHYQSKKFKYMFYKKNIKYLILLSSILFFITLIFFTFIIDYKLILLIPLLILVFIRYYSSSISYNLGESPLDLILRDRVILISSLIIIIYTILNYY